MLGSICLALLISPSRFTPVADSYAPAKEAFGTLVKIIKKSVPNAHFHGGASLMGGVLNANGSASYSIVTHDAAPHYVVLTGQNSATKLTVDVVDNTGKSVVTQRKNGGISLVQFQGLSRGGFKIVAKNENGASNGDFFALAILVDGGGVQYSTSSISSAVGRLATGIQAGFGKGYGFTPNKITVVGGLIDHGGTYTYNGKMGGDRWLSLVTSDSDVLSMNVAFRDKAKKEIAPANVEDGDYRLYELKSQSATMSLTNTGSNGLLTFFCTMD